MKVRITETVSDWLSGTQLFQAPDDIDKHGYGEGGRSLVAKWHAAKSRKDGSITVELDRYELGALTDYAEAMYGSSRDDARWDPKSRGDMNAAAALLRQVERRAG
jgi:hypothetical protein